MNAMEIILLLVGGVVFVVSFLLPAGREEEKKENRELVKAEIKGFVSEEMDGVKSRVDDVVGEAVDYAMEKTERSLERISNEKIMAVNQYSDTVLEEIHKNHQEVMFLYDMLNEKHNHLKKTVKEVNKTVKEAEDSVQKLAPEVQEPVERLVEEKPEKISTEEKNTNSGDFDISFTQETPGEDRNCNDKILALYREGKSKVAIAKELGLGVGEVKLVIDLYKKM